ncbi:MAG: hypothetical protein M1573_00950 [Candidatus Parvarchaeota archaeon]|jgi:RPA family protein|nr:hypothetical protein [Candidatus Parvarchaeota archaeon]MCL5017795.1 hypothetical protein [Candidatus Parvarchaeota archaeon]
MDFTFFMVPLSVINDGQRISDSEGSCIEIAGKKMYRLHVIGSVYTMDFKEETGSGYLVLDDTFSSILVHFEKQSFRMVERINKGDFVEVLGSIDIYNENVTLSLNNIISIGLDRYCYNKVQSILNLKDINGK